MIVDPPGDPGVGRHQILEIAHWFAFQQNLEPDHAGRAGPGIADRHIKFARSIIVADIAAVELQQRDRIGAHQPAVLLDELLHRLPRVQRHIERPRRHQHHRNRNGDVEPAMAIPILVMMDVRRFGSFDHASETTRHRYKRKPRRDCSQRGLQILS